MKRKVIFALRVFLLTIVSVICINAQSEILTNDDVIAMSKAKLDTQVIIAKINASEHNFNTTTKALIRLKTEMVDDKIIALIVEVSKKKEKLQTRQVEKTKVGDTELSEAAPKPTRNVDYKTPAQLLREAKTIAFKKDSIYPSIKDLESSLLKKERKSKWDKFNLVITQYKADADLVMEIGREFGTHYNFRVLDVKTGRVIAASGVTSLGGALAGNVADKLIKRLNEVLGQK